VERDDERRAGERNRRESGIGGGVYGERGDFDGGEYGVGEQRDGGRGWKTANTLQVGDTFLTSDDRRVVLERIEDHNRYVAVYNLEVEADHTYFVGGSGWGFDVWSHNHDTTTPAGQQGWLNENNQPLTGGHHSGHGKPLTTGASPNSVYTHVDPRTGVAKQNVIYDADGNVVAHVDFKRHGMAPSGHAHPIPKPGQPDSGHTHNYTPIQPSDVPPGWLATPPNALPQQPIGS